MHRAVTGTVIIAAMMGVCAPAARGQDAQDGARAKLPDMVTPKTVAAVQLGLKYLANMQRADGGWLSNGRFGTYPSAMTGLSGLAMLSAGSTPEEGPHARHVRKAVTFLVRAAQVHDDGLIATGGSEGRSMHGHGFAMLFLGQCYGMVADREQNRELRDVLTKAAELTSASQSDLTRKMNDPSLRHAGGWYYSPTGNNDEGSVTVTQLQALRACRNAGIKVSKNTIERAVLYLKYCQQSDGGICYSARSRGSSRPAISAAAIACFYAAGVYDRATGGQGEEAEMVERLVRYCKKAVGTNLGGSGHWFYTQFYYVQAMYQRGGKDWEDYYPRLRDRLLKMQAPDGSWNGDGVGTVYGTAMAIVSLQLPYGHLPIYQR